MKIQEKNKYSLDIKESEKIL